jgi:hypothetical protein
MFAFNTQPTPLTPLPPHVSNSFNKREQSSFNTSPYWPRRRELPSIVGSDVVTWKICGISLENRGLVETRQDSKRHKQRFRQSFFIMQVNTFLKERKT